MALSQAVFRSLYGAYRLARLDPDGLNYFDTTPSGFWFSFSAAILSVPIFAVVLAASWIEAPGEAPVWRILIVEFIAYVIAWTALPAILPLVLRALDREQHFIRGVVAYNWTSVIQNFIYLPIAVSNLMGITNGSPIGLIILLLVLFYSWYVAKVALDIRPLAAWGIVMLDILISLVLNFWSESIIYG